MLLRPDMKVHRISDIRAEDLHARGIRGILLDVDNTITAWHSMELSRQVCTWVGDMLQAGFRVCILSNGHAERVLPLTEQLGVPAIHNARKPLACGYRRACALLDLPAKQIAMVGDQLFTDIAGANKLGMTSILTEIIDKKEFWGTRHISRRAEYLAKKIWRI